MSDEEFKLPGSSLGEVEKIIEAFAQKVGPSTNVEVAQLAGTNSSTVSRNNGFLASVGLIKGGKKKEPTELGTKLGHALHHEQHDDAQRYWRETIMASAFLSEQLTAVRVQKGVKTDELAGKILYNSGAGKNKYSEAGSRTVVDVLTKARLLVEADGKYQVPKEGQVPELSAAPTPVQTRSPTPEPLAATRPPKTQARTLEVAVNLQLQLPDFEDPKKYAELFKALRTHLLDPPETEE